MAVRVDIRSYELHRKRCKFLLTLPLVFDHKHLLSECLCNRNIQTCTSWPSSTFARSHLFSLGVHPYPHPKFLEIWQDLKYDNQKPAHLPRPSRFTVRGCEVNCLCSCPCQCQCQLQSALVRTKHWACSSENPWAQTPQSDHWARSPPI
jgi:hypothetical protein